MIPQINNSLSSIGSSEEPKHQLTGYRAPKSTLEKVVKMVGLIFASLLVVPAIFIYKHYGTLSPIKIWKKLDWFQCDGKVKQFGSIKFFLELTEVEGLKSKYRSHYALD